MRPLLRKRMELHKEKDELRRKAEEALWLKHPANMQFEEGLQHWGPPGDPKALKRGWVKTGVVTSDPQGRPSAFLLSTIAPNPGVITLRQTIKADDYRGKQLRFSGEVKTEQIERQGGLYIRTDVIGWKRLFGIQLPNDPPIQAYTTDESMSPQHLVQGTHDWMRCEATIPVAEDAIFVRFGLVLYGRGQIWLRDAQLEVVEPRDGQLPVVKS